jgi:hypothetical protein
LLIPSLVDCCVAVCAVDRHLLPGVLTLLIREFARPHRIRHRRPWAAQWTLGRYHFLAGQLTCQKTLAKSRRRRANRCLRGRRAAAAVALPLPLPRRRRCCAAVLTPPPPPCCRRCRANAVAALTAASAVAAPL